jgi:isoleucyl-tRNA synthetase
LKLSILAYKAKNDNFSFKENEIKLDDKPELDRWIISELNTLIRNVEKFYDDYEPTKAAREITNFVTDNLSNWYVRLSRRRFWKGEYELDKISAYQTLFTVLVDICKISAPISPFFMDKMFQDLTKNIEGNFQQSVHLEAFPEYDTSKIDKSLEEKKAISEQKSYIYQPER